MLPNTNPTMTNHGLEVIEILEPIIELPWHRVFFFHGTCNPSMKL